jgi:hypothetical protein
MQTKSNRLGEYHVSKTNAILMICASNCIVLFDLLLPISHGLPRMPSSGNAVLV